MNSVFRLGLVAAFIFPLTGGVAGAEEAEHPFQSFQALLAPGLTFNAQGVLPDGVKKGWSESTERTPAGGHTLYTRTTFHPGKNGMKYTRDHKLKIGYDADGVASITGVNEDSFEPNFSATVRGGQVQHVTVCNFYMIQRCVTANASVCQHLRKSLGAKSNAEALAKAESCASVLEGNGPDVLGPKGVTAAEENRARILLLRTGMGNLDDKQPPTPLLWSNRIPESDSRHAMAWSVRTAATLCNNTPFTDVEPPRPAAPGADAHK